MAYPKVVWFPYSDTSEYDEWGNEVPAEPAEGIEVDAAFAPESTAESGSSGISQRVLSDAKLYLRVPIRYSQQDVFLVDGVRYAVVGQNPGWYGRYSRQCMGQEILLKRAGG